MANKVFLDIDGCVLPYKNADNSKNEDYSTETMTVFNRAHPFERWESIEREVLVHKNMREWLSQIAEVSEIFFLSSAGLEAMDLNILLGTKFEVVIPDAVRLSGFEKKTTLHDKTATIQEYSEKGDSIVWIDDSLQYFPNVAENLSEALSGKVDNERLLLVSPDRFAGFTQKDVATTLSFFRDRGEE